jgi:membrane protease subunit HflC
MKKIVFIVFALIAFIVVYSSYFIVNETEQVVITRFGDPVGKPIMKAGVYFKIPVIDTANYIDKWIQEWDGNVENAIPTRDKKNIIVDTTARWKIVDPLLFIQTVGSTTAAHSRLDDIVDSNVRDIISRHDLIEIVRNSNRVVEVINKDESADLIAAVEDTGTLLSTIQKGRDAITREILSKSKPIIEKYGIELIDVRIKGLMYSKAVLENVYARMNTEYGVKAQRLRSEGDRQKLQIQGQTEYQVKKIRSEAYAKAQGIKGEADATATKIYADAYQMDPAFYNFQKSLEAYQNGVDKNTTLIIGTDAQFFKTLKSGQ